VRPGDSRSHMSPILLLNYTALQGVLVYSPDFDYHVMVELEGV
jgi:hypothetical protein